MIIRVKVKPNSFEQSIEKIEEVYIVRLKSPAEKGKANAELISFLKKHFRVSEVNIRSGFNSRKKIIELLD